MPPTYKPIALPANIGAVGAPPPVFNTQAEDFTDAEKVQAALLAAQLANDKNTLSNQQAQQAADEQNAVRDALKAQYGDMTDNTDFNPQDALKTAQRIALQNGDLTSAINIQKAAKEAATSRVLSQDEIDALAAQGVNLPAGATVSDAQMIQRAMSYGQTGQKLSGIQNRFDKSFGLKESQTNAPGLFENVTDSQGNPQPIDNSQKDKLANIQIGTDSILRNADSLANAIDNDKVDYGDALLAQKQFVANMLPALRKLDNQGVRFNEFLKGIDINQVGDDASLVDRIVGTFTGQDPAEAVRRFAAEVGKQAQITANSYNGTFSPTKIAAFDPTGETFDLYNKYGLFQRGQKGSSLDMSGVGQLSPDIQGALSRAGGASGAAGGVPLANYGGGVPRNPDGSLLSKEQFMQLYNSQKGQ